jgi:aspartate/methionine/tyrosine aminotransferase
MLPRLRNLGFSIPVDPEGAFYIYAGIDRWGIDSMVFVQRALAEAKVAITPGYDFGSYKAASHVRFSYANSIERLNEGCNRLGKWLNTFVSTKKTIS